MTPLQPSADNPVAWAFEQEEYGEWVTRLSLSKEAGEGDGKRNLRPLYAHPSRGVVDEETIAVLRRIKAALPDVGVNGWMTGVKALDTTIAALQAAALPAVPDGWVLAPHYRGYAHLGSGGYFMYHSGKGDLAELVIVPATDADREGRTVGDLSYDGPDEIPAEHMAVRLRLDNVAGLDALEQQLRLLRDEHFAATPAHDQPEGEGGWMPIATVYPKKVQPND